MFHLLFVVSCTTLPLSSGIKKQRETVALAHVSEGVEALTNKAKQRSRCIVSVILVLSRLFRNFDFSDTGTYSKR